MYLQSLESSSLSSMYYFFYLLLFSPLLPFVPKLFRVLITVAYVGKAFLKSLVVYVPEISHEDSKEFKYIAERN